MFVLLRALGRLPLACLHAAGAVLGWIVYWASPIYASRLRTNLAASGIFSDPAELDLAIRACVAETGKGALELAKIWFGDRNEVAGLVECTTWHVVDAAQREGRG